MLAARSVILDGCAAQRDLVLEAARGQHVVARQLIVADDPATLPDADRRAGSDDDRFLKAGHLIAQEAVILTYLAPPFQLGISELRRISRIDIRYARHVDHDHSFEWRAMPRPLQAREDVLLGLRRLAHHGPQIGLLGFACARDVDIGQAK